MVYRVVSTKLTEEQHTVLLEECNKQGLTPSSLVRNAILDRLKARENILQNEADEPAAVQAEAQTRPLTALEKLMASHRKRKAQ